MIGIDAHVLGDCSGGNETYYKNLIENLPNNIVDDIILFVNPGYDVEALGFKGRVVQFKSTNSFIRNFIEIPVLMKKYSLSCMHMQYFIPFIRPCPVITTIHDISFEHFDDIFTKKEMFIQKKLIPYAARKSDFVFTVSEYSKNDICATYGIDEERVIVTYNGKSEKYRVNKDEKVFKKIREKYELPDEYILCVGNVQPRKNLKRLIRAYAMYLKGNPTGKPLVIVGKKAWMFEEIFKEFHELKLENKIIFTGYVEDIHLPIIYSYATLFVYPSIFEGFGLPVLEAMACGVPTITSNVTSLPEVAGDACVFVDPYDEQDISDAICNLLNDKTKRDMLSARGLLQADKFSWKRTAEETVKIYNNYRRKS